jgi:hypothetical protein
MQNLGNVYICGSCYNTYQVRDVLASKQETIVRIVLQDGQQEIQLAL